MNLYQYKHASLDTAQVITTQTIIHDIADALCFWKFTSIFKFENVDE